MNTAHTHAEEHSSAHDDNMQAKAKRAAVNGLAVVGFLALIMLGIMLAIYGAQFVPDTLSRLTSAVYLSSEPDETPAPGATTTRTATTTVTVFVPVPATSTPAATTTTQTPTTPTPSTGGPLIVRQPTYTFYPNTPTLFGRSDLTVEIIEVGKLTNSSTASFRRDSEIDDSEVGAFRFRVQNNGTNATGSWRFQIEFPTEDSDDVYTSGIQSSLMPGASRTYTMGFDDPEVGENRRIEIVVDHNDNVNETSERNNDDSATIDVER